LAIDRIFRLTRRIIDGDTIDVLHNQHPERIRLSGIDCPEKGQAYGKRAKQAASELVFGKEVTLQTFGKDKCGRTIADLLLPDGTNVNRSLVKDGWCWWYRKKGNCPEGCHRFNILPDLTENQSASLALTDYTNRIAPELIVAP
jgi:endonuclease YncB( thermonuclease family)